MKKIEIAAEWQNIWCSQGQTKYYVEKKVNQTILGSCLYFNQRNLTNYSLGKTMKEQKGDYLLLQSFCAEAREQIRAGDTAGLKITVRLFGDPQRKKLLVQRECAFSSASRAYTISWDNALKVALQKLFPVSTALAIVCGKDLKIGDTSWLIERLGIAPFRDGQESGLELFPLYQMNVEDEHLSQEERLMLQVLVDYSSNRYLNTARSRKESRRRHLNAFQTSTEWKDAKEFRKGLSALENCIYTLASDPDENGVRKVYVGEAKVSGNRLKVFRTSTGKLCIDHTKEEAEDHQFTRFRLDQLKEDAFEFLHDAQDSIIGTMWMAAQECPQGFIMVNSPDGGLCTSISNASKADRIKRKQDR